MKLHDKKGVQKQAAAFGCEALYSGKERKMYIHGIREKEAVASINEWPPLFTVVAGEHIVRKHSL
jgi:hypothetical protein